MSDSQSRNTFQPRRWRSWSSNLSRWILAPIFFVQYKALAPLCSLCFRAGQFLPCQKSPSQKTTTRCFVKTMSGLPGRSLTFFRKRRPIPHSTWRSCISHFVSMDLVADKTRLAVGDEAVSKRGTRIRCIYGIHLTLTVISAAGETS